MLISRLLQTTASALSRTPLCALYVVADALNFVVYRLMRYRLKIVRGNLEIAFPRKSERERRAIERRFYRHLCDYFVETLKTLTINQFELRRRFVIRNPEVINDMVDRGQSVFICAAHFGNWEWFAALPHYIRGKLQLFYQSQKSLIINDLLLRLRTYIDNKNYTAVESQKGYKHIMQCMQRGVQTTTLILADQSPHSGAKKCWVPFFERDTAFLLGAATMAKRAGIAMVYPAFFQPERGRYEVDLQVIATPEELSRLDLQTLVERYAALLEADILRTPELWLWTHKRWKHKREDFA